MAHLKHESMNIYGYFIMTQVKASKVDMSVSFTFFIIIFLYTFYMSFNCSFFMSFLIIQSPCLLGIAAAEYLEYELLADLLHMYIKPEEPAPCPPTH